jgi:hypothetical protein
MAPLIAQFETVLRQIVHEHRALLAGVASHEQAIRSRDIARIARAASDADAIRQRITRLDSARRMLVAQITRQHRQIRTPTLTGIAEAFPDRREVLLKLRDDLQQLIEQIRTHNNLIQRVASGVLGHLGATVRIIAEAATGPATYSRRGTVAVAPGATLVNAVG